jgi:HAD superfamily hydrolase (TIGR01490 family)
MKLAIFDYNGTIFPKETLSFLLSEWYRQKYSRLKLLRVFLTLLPLFLKYKLFGSSGEKEIMEVTAVRKFTDIFIGMNKEEIIEYFKTAALSASEHNNRKILSEIRKLKDGGYHTILLSGAFELYIEEVAQELGIETVIGSEIFFKDNLYTEGNVKIISGSNKLANLKKLFTSDSIDWSESYAYADSYHDLELLESVGHPVAVGPDQELERIAREHCWPIID